MLVVCAGRGRECLGRAVLVWCKWIGVEKWAGLERCGVGGLGTKRSS